LSVLVVDGDTNTADSTAKILELAGFAARVAGSGEEAVRSVAVEPPDAVLFELRLPDMCGWELARRIEGSVGPRDLQPLLVAVTGVGRDADRRASEAEGIDLHLVKPVEPAVLVGLLRRFERVVCPSPGLRDEATIRPSCEST